MVLFWKKTQILTLFSVEVYLILLCSHRIFTKIVHDCNYFINDAMKRSSNKCVAIHQLTIVVVYRRAYVIIIENVNCFIFLIIGGNRL